MNKDIKFNGISATPAGNLSIEGDLEVSMNLINEDSSLWPIAEPHRIGAIPHGWDARYVHYNSVYRHIIVFSHSLNRLGWLDFPSGIDHVDYSQESVTLLDAPEAYHGGTISGIVGVGNTLVVLTDKGILYYLWKSDKDGYIILGDHLPECLMKFGLSLDSSHLGLFENKMINDSRSHPTHVQQVNTISLEAEAGIEYLASIRLDDDKKNENTDAVLGSVNQVMAECRKKGFFLNNFFVRYAFRLYDGSLSMHSSPILMICSSDRVSPIVKAINQRDPNNLGKAEIEIFAPKFRLKCASLMDSAILDAWSDIIKSVDIFITPEISNLNADGVISNANNSVGDIIMADKFNGGLFAASGYALQSYFIAEAPESDSGYRRGYFRDLLKKSYPDAIYANYMKVIEVPVFSDSNLLNQYTSNADFHLLHSYDISKLPSEMASVPIDDEYLTSLSQRELMSDDDNFSHDKLFAKSAFAYNSRINIANVARIPFDGYDMRTISPACDYSDHPGAVFTLHFFIRENGKEVVVSKGIAQNIPPFIFYPNPFVYRCILAKSAFSGGIEWTTTFYDLPVKTHDTLNGSFFFDGFMKGGVYETLLNTVIKDEPPVFFPDFCETTDKGPSPDEINADKTIEYPNKIYTAPANNPFVFSAENVNSLGAAEVLAMASVTKALSAGQFGQFPLYAFTSEGVWAMETSSTGSVASLHPVTRDVCTNIDSITQIDDAVLFCSARGIMLLSGSNVTCISDTINSSAPFDCTCLPGITKMPHEFSALLHKPVPFLKYLDGCRLMYDYTHQRIIVYPVATVDKRANPSFVYSLRSKMWGMMKTDIKLSLNCYPDAIAISAGNDILNYSYESGDASPCLSPQLLISRPLQLGLPNILKTIDSLIMRGQFLKGHVYVILYGSRDLINWHLVWSSRDHYLRGFRGSPYKYFRIVAPCDMDYWESISDCSVQFSPRLTNQPR